MNRSKSQSHKWNTADTITSVRIAASLFLLLLPLRSAGFLVVYTLTGLTDFTSEEMAHIAGILQRYDGPVNVQALRDCARTIRMEHQTGAVRTREDIMALRSRLQERKGIKQ